MKKVFGGRRARCLGWIADHSHSMAESRSSSPEYRALGENVIRDDRVSAKRAKKFHQWAAAKGHTGSLSDALSQYHKFAVRTDPLGTFLDPVINGHNFVSGKPRDLATVVDVTGLGFVLQRAGGRVAELEDFTPATTADPDALNALLRSELGIDKAARRRTAVAVILRAMNLALAEPDLAHHPIWTADWRDFVARADPKQATSWLRAVGVGPPSGERWLIVLKYTSTAAGQLVRPTQLDAGAYAYHFPSPRRLGAGRGGQAAWLKLKHARHPKIWLPLREFIHHQVPFRDEYYDDDAFPAGLTEAACDCPLLPNRARHLSALQQHFPKAGIVAWSQLD